MNRQMSWREHKKKLFEKFKSTPFSQALEEIGYLSPRQMVNLLFPLILSTHSRVKWNAVLAMGAVTQKIAGEDQEAARNILRRLMWNLNDESGGIGWGSAEAMGEILSHSEVLAPEFFPILVSYIREDGNYQENEIMQRGVLWGIGRVSGYRADMVRPYKQYLRPYLQAPDQGARGLTAWIMGRLALPESGPALQKLLNDESEFETCLDDQVVTRTVSELAREALTRLYY